jgi:hypothetical protein
MTRYLPAPFPLYEFVGRPDATEAERRRTERRWFAHWDGPVGRPAEEVVLGWSQGDVTVLVCTSGRSYDRDLARWRTAHLALGGTLLTADHADRASMSTAAKGRELARIRDSDELWSPCDGLLPSSPAPSTAEVADCRDYVLAYAILEQGPVMLAAVGSVARDLLVRRVEDWLPYGVDATRDFTV